MIKTLKQNSKRLFYKHKVVTRITSMLLVFTLLFTSLPLGGMVASAAEVDKEDTIITVVEELTEYRTEYSKTYLMSNNTLESVISANPMHYKNDSGNWVDIDSTLVLEETEDGEVYKNKAGGFDVSFPAKNENGSSVKIESGEHTIEIELVEGKKAYARKDTSNKNKAKKLTKEQRKVMTASELYAVDSNQNSALEYNEVFDNTNIRYDINPTSVKESVIINKAPNKKVSYSYNIKADGLVAELNDDGSIAFYEKTDTKKQTAIFVMPAPLMYDANDIYCYDIETTLKQKKGVYVLTYKPDYNWLKSKERAYPVVLDPTTYIANSTQDAYTYSADEYQNRNIGTEDQIKVGRSTWKDPDGDTFETFIRFDELPTIPDGYVVNSALLMLTTKAYHGTWQELDVGAHKITEDWTNKLNQPLDLITYLNQPSAESFPRATAHIVRGDVDTEVGFEISEIVNEWYEDPTTNYGVKLSLAEAPPTDADNVLFHSSRATSGIPYLSITYDVHVPVTEVEITKSEETLDCSENGYNFDVEATVSPANASYKRVDWQVEDESVAFYYDGKIYARGNGETTVTAVSVDDNTVTDSFDLEVTTIPTIPAENFSITNLPVDNILSLGNRCAVLAVAKDSNQQDIAISNENVAWVSSNESIVTVNELGEITAKGVGTATITATFAGVSTSFSITVKPEVFFELQSQYNYLLTGEEITFIGKFNPADAADLRTKCTIISYSDGIINSEGVEEKEIVELTRLSGDDAPATEYTQYKLKGLVPGKATIRLEAYNDSTIYKYLTIDVVSDNIVFNELYQNTLLEGHTWTFAGNPYAQIKVADQSILSVQNGTTVKALKAGTTSIEVWLRNKERFTRYTVIVEQNLNISITNKPIFIDSDGNEYTDSIYIGQTYNSLKLMGNVSGITSINVVSGDTTVARAYYDTAKARIVLDGVAEGTAEIAVYVNGNTIAADSFILNVKPLPIDGFFIEAYGRATEDGVLYLYETGMLALDIYPLQAESSFNKADWYVYMGNKDTVSFTPYSKYQVKVKAEKEGLVEINAIINGKHANYTFPLTVKKPEINITRRPQNNKMLIGDTFTLGWNYEPSYAKVTWSSKSPNVASINATDDGVVTINANSKGEAIICAVGKYPGCEFTKTITIKVQQSATGVAITNLPQNNALEIGGTHTLNATVLPENASNKNIVWKSSNESVASIDGNGKITAIYPGTTTISASIPGGIKQQVSITVYSSDPFHESNIEYIRIKKFDASEYGGDKEIITIVTKSKLSPYEHFEITAPERATATFEINEILVNKLISKANSYPDNFPTLFSVDWCYYVGRYMPDIYVEQGLIEAKSAEYYGIWASETNNLLIDLDEGASIIQLVFATITAAYSIYNIVSAIKSAKLSINSTQTYNAQSYKIAASNVNDMFDELSANGIKFTKENTMWITRTYDGKICWLETGTASSGFKHILNNHPVSQFSSFNVSSELGVSSLIYNTVSTKTPVGTCGSGGLVYSFGNQKYLNVVISSNGYIVNAYNISNNIGSINFY